MNDSVTVRDVTPSNGGAVIINLLPPFDSDFDAPTSVKIRRHESVGDTTTISAHVTSLRRSPANRNWLKAHFGEYRGIWLALRDGTLLGANPSLETLVQQVSEEFGVTFPSREIMITTGY